MNYKKGFSFAEIIVVIGILGLIMIAVSNFQKDVFVYNKFAQESLLASQDARNVLKVMVKEIRTASPGSDGSYSITTAATNTVAFFADTDEDGLKEKIRYYIATTTLMKGNIKPTGNPLTYNSVNEIFTTMAYNVKNATSTPLFEYYDNTYAGTSSPLTQPLIISDVRLVKINLMIDSDPNRSPVVRTYTSQVNIRNLKDNL